MRVKRAQKPSNPAAMVFTGNGGTEYRVLLPLAAKLNGREKVLWFPEAPLRSKSTGLSALRALQIFATSYQLSRFLFLIDREHAQDLNRVRQHLQKELGRITLRYTLVPDTAGVFEGATGAERFELCVVLLGKVKAVEEELAQLVQGICPHKKVPCDKGIHKFLRAQGLRLSDVIQGASLDALRAAFPGLYKALKWVEAYW